MKRHPKASVVALTLLVCLALGVGLAAATVPVVSVEDATSVGFTSAKVKGEVDSQEQSTSWRFQYITDALYEENINVNALPGFEGATDGPGGTVESGADAISRKLTGLAPGTTYHLRLLAVNGDGPSAQDERREKLELHATFLLHSQVGVLGEL